MRFFPKIKFVDKLPDSVLFEFPLISPSRIAGTYNFKTKQIYVVKGKRDKLVLLHELAHWAIDIFTSSDKQIHPLQRWFDKHFSTNIKRKG